MVARNCLQKSDDGEGGRVTAPPRRFAFNIGDYRVAIHRQFGKQFFHVSIWHERQKIGSIDFYGYYRDVKTVYTVDTKIRQEYQGYGIAHRTYQGLVGLHNLAILSGCQSPGAVKLWRRMATDRSLAMYFVEDCTSDCLFSCDVYPVNMNATGRLRGTDYANKEFDPYKLHGSLLLVRRQHALDKTIDRHMTLRRETMHLRNRYHRYDQLRW